MKMREIIEADMDPTRRDNIDVIDRPRPPELHKDSKKRVGRPPMYAVMLHNDDYTSGEFIIMMLEKYFNRNEQESEQIMIAAHKNGMAVVGVYTKDVAETKTAEALKDSVHQGYSPHILSVQEDDAGDDD